MSDNLPISSKYRSQADQPVSEEERNDLNSRLNEAFGRGELSHDEYQQGLERLYAASNLGELVPVVSKLPAKQTYDQPAIVEQSAGKPGELTEAAQPSNKLVMYAGVAVGGAVALIVVLLMLVLFVF
ncbi:DUF1707 SHOCT-like domain-containing protein [Parenemella sanctibonifatiensis]|uniref:DUF1707 domain-containing protein n=1 Tax=Parenemella sanctibonifatiensis TaxID=2016505 RepID=A0A255ECT2_9ACTN|nr:DUF1707 domain-containing protein [Parenemella sanctibonifatiensis]OYN87583.1 hypothetical protein CGZ92_07735 [Parenemella sanctibonifatiensis]OYN89070.1 hypothetical protein CGZ91_12460 [Parenemella sanctibonifatiensis]